MERTGKDWRRSACSVYPLRRLCGRADALRFPFRCGGPPKSAGCGLGRAAPDHNEFLRFRGGLSLTQGAQYAVQFFDFPDDIYAFFRNVRRIQRAGEHIQALFQTLQQRIAVQRAGTS